MNQQTAEKILTEAGDAVTRGNAGSETPLTDEQRLAAKIVAGVLKEFGETILVLAGGLAIASTHGDVVETTGRLDAAVSVLGP